MAKPVAYFGYSINGLDITLKNMSLNNPTAQEWDFGDNTPKDSRKNPQHTYSTPGLYEVSLTVTNDDGTGEPLTIRIGIGDNVEILGNNIYQLIDQYMPTGLRGELDHDEKVSLIQKWQLYLQPLIEEPKEVNKQDTHNEQAWPALANILIAQLSAYDIILQGANQFLAQSGKEGGSSSGSTETPGTGVQQKKSIETGPTKVEWYQDETKSTEDMSNIGKAFSSSIRAGGALDMLKESICQLSRRVGVYLPMCGQDNQTLVPIVNKSKKTTVLERIPSRNITEKIWR